MTGLPGSVAKLTVVEAASRGTSNSDSGYAGAGVVVTAVTLILSIGWIRLFIWK